MQRAQEVYEKLRKGDCLSDQDINFGRTYYRELERKLIACGPVFHLAWVEAARVYRAFEDFYQARLRKG